ncbi:SRPBCC family protein [Actinomyces israelii]|uniref:SRPBCC family protein n=1 Tax=Actinomyces israelii TaxID=1659 RepID=UPI00255292AB|nr:Clp protease N-terminal domain-containing protein [Actinomyces israelii]WKR21616.1 hypothetical protein AIF0345_1539 [Actinomyces israelii]
MPHINHYLTWVNATSSEAVRLRHRQIEPEHLLLGLIAQGGRAAAILGAHGVTLARARAAVDELADADLARVGIRLPEGLRPEPLAAGDLIAGPGAGEIPVSRAATEALDTAGRGPAGDPGIRVLLALTARTQSPAARLLTHCDVDVTAVRTQAEAARARPEPAPGRYRLTDEYASYGLDRELSQERFVSVPAADLAALLSDPAGLTRWAVPREELVELRADGAVQQAAGRCRTGRMRWRLEEAAPGRIVWSCTAASGPRDGEVCLVRDLALTRAPGGTRVRLTLAHRTWGRFGPVVYRASWRWIRLGAGQTLTGIARAGAELP